MQRIQIEREDFSMGIVSEDDVFSDVPYVRVRKSRVMPQHGQTAHVSTYPFLIDLSVSPVLKMFDN